MLLAFLVSSLAASLFSRYVYTLAFQYPRKISASSHTWEVFRGVYLEDVADYASNDRL